MTGTKNCANFGGKCNSPPWTHDLEDLFHVIIIAFAGGCMFTSFRNAGWFLELMLAYWMLRSSKVCFYCDIHNCSIKNKQIIKLKKC